MTKGFLVLAQNSDIDYVRQAYALALSIKATQPSINNISIVTNDEVPEEYKHVFDKIIPIPFVDHAADSTWKVENRWKMYYASPYEETIVLDSDMLFLSNMENLWDFVKHRNLFFTSTVLDYKGRTITDTVYRKMFIENHLPNLYSGLYYFRKSQEASIFFKLLEFITYNWERIYFDIAPNKMQKHYSVDVSVAIASKILGNDDVITLGNSPFKFVHMKPAIQGWDPVPSSYLSQSLIYFNSKKQLYVNNFKQVGIFHYVENEFLTDEIIGGLNVQS
jgi:hypothetical protein